MGIGQRTLFELIRLVRVRCLRLSPTNVPSDLLTVTELSTYKSHIRLRLFLTLFICEKQF